MAEQAITFSLAELMSRSPYMCGICPVCKSTPDRWGRLREYRKNLDPGEEATLESAVSWMRGGYPACKEFEPPPF